MVLAASTGLVTTWRDEAVVGGEKTLVREKGEAGAKAKAAGAERIDVIAKERNNMVLIYETSIHIIGDGSNRWLGSHHTQIALPWRVDSHAQKSKNHSGPRVVRGLLR